MEKYDPKSIEAKWQKLWLEQKSFAAHDSGAKQKYYQLETFPYPSGAGLHVGHPKGFIAEDIHARYMRMQGREVLYTMGWDAFGLPTENYAIKIGKTPKEVAALNIENFRRQVRMFGLSYDWDREIDTSSPEYYKWTQWLFLQLYKKGLAYQKKGRVNWCPNDQTVLANEQVVDGHCDRCGAVIEEREMEQWFFRITDYAERLLNDLKGLDWPAATVKRQEDWIGKSEGALLTFALHTVPGQKDGAHTVQVFTTRPDTLFGATFLVISPELAESWLQLGWQVSEETNAYVKKSLSRTERDRMENVNDKTGVDTGIKAVNPATKEEIPVWVADYVLGSYGTGAIMAVPAHDERDFAFAKKFGLPIIKVITPGAQADLSVVAECWAGDGALIHSGQFDGMDSEKVKDAITAFVGGKKKTQYKIRDWSVSRQRYWGAPIPIIHCEKCGIVPVPEKDLPVLLPDDVDYRPKGMPPLASSASFMNVKCPSCGGDAKRAPETLDTFVDSSWYYLRYTDAHNNTAPFAPEKAKHWMPVDLYVIGAEHTVLHLLYSRFITKFLCDEKLLSLAEPCEPFLKVRHVGLIMGADGQKMSKSKGNVVNPDPLVEEFGADTVRLYEMFMGPFENGQPWDPQGVLGTNRFLGRLWKFAMACIAHGFPDATASAANAALHRAIKKTGEAIEQFGFNTAVSSFMILLNELEAQNNTVAKEDFESILKILHPFAPHITQELWSRLGHDTLLDFEAWPSYDPKSITASSFMLVIQIQGKMRDSIEVPLSIDEAEATRLALAREKVQSVLKGAAPTRIIYVAGKLINIVV